MAGQMAAFPHSACLWPRPCSLYLWPPTSLIEIPLHALDYNLEDHYHILHTPTYMIYQLSMQGVNGGAILSKYMLEMDCNNEMTL